MIKNCLVCSKEFHTTPSRLKDGKGKYCSKKCGYIAIKQAPYRGVNRITTKCLFCDKSFYTYKAILDKGRDKYCSKRCGYNAQLGKVAWNKKEQVSIFCKYCKKEFLVKPFNVGKRKFCSHICATAYNSPRTIKFLKKICPIDKKIFITKPWQNYIRCCSEDCKLLYRKKRFKEKTEKLKIKKACLQCKEQFSTWPSRITSKNYCSKKCHSASMIGNIPWNKGRESILKGDKHYNWQGGKTAKQLQIIHSFEYRQLRLKIFKRDNYTCVICHDKRGGSLEMDHILPQSLFPELRYDLNNCRTLCHDCHKRTFTYLNGKMRREDFTYALPD